MTICVIDQRRETDRPLACDPCRVRLAADLRALVDAYAVLSATETGELLDAGPVPGQNRSERVSGSGEASVPVNLDVVDLTLRAGPVGVIVDPFGDQIGNVPVATILDAWVRDWIDVRARGEHLPVPTVVTLADWLGKRLDWACDSHPAVDEFATEIRSALRACQRAAGDAPVRPEVLIGVPCATPSCDGILLHRPGDDYWAECSECGRLWSDDEYRQWVRMCAASASRAA